MPLLRSIATNGLLIPRVAKSIWVSSPVQVRLHSTSKAIPRLAQRSVWTSMIPKFLRNRSAKDASDTPKSKEWNPASFYIIIFILIGSQAIRMIALKNDYKAYTRTTDAKILLLREVIERVKNGEKVDVEKLLGTGDAGKEREWEEVLREIEAEDSLWHRKSKNSGAEQQPEVQKEQKWLVSTDKEPVIPEEKENAEPSKDSSSQRKINFF
ncbi:hypothetical protein EYZ11_000145 [Aspergillus tanneri]|uniref:Uncharacterized protein n=1 Tax=Aspergillus tanneri TaxID=1220188 RepID=A0A4S3JY61_9EURO|nr:uncharacterized protein ATNIH1004_005660 [Aspergillus tanneri]KAA8646981.1 hypothetical protein ATNIH1004_005660 [Aspergillus tanneri]THD00418.1 hypothetical protein EYZ11_000145 [Aspergillus tanneri]